MREMGVIVLAWAVCGVAFAGDLPRLSAEGQNAWGEYELADRHRAFAVAPGGAWAWLDGLPSAEAAERAALAACAEQTEQTCVSYAVDDAVVFDRLAWTRLWRPYADAGQAAQARTGTARGERFPDLAWRDPAGQPGNLSSLRGKVVVLHFWASWCPPCLAELPELAKLYRIVQGDPGITFVLLQVREPVARARDWLARKGFSLPQYDSGADSRAAEQVTLADGSRLADRSVAELFPTTYVLDKHGLVLFRSRGVEASWPDYAPFLRDAAE